MFVPGFQRPAARLLVKEMAGALDEPEATSTLVKLFVPAKVWLALSNGILLERRASASVPETSVPNATRLGVQSVPLKRKTCPTVGDVARTLTPRIRPTVVEPEGPVTSPLSVTETFVAVALILVKPLPSPAKLPANLLPAFVQIVTPLTSKAPMRPPPPT